MIPPTVTDTQSLLLADPPRDTSGLYPYGGQSSNSLVPSIPTSSYSQASKRKQVVITRSIEDLAAEWDEKIKHWAPPQPKYTFPIPTIIQPSVAPQPVEPIARQPSKLRKRPRVRLPRVKLDAIPDPTKQNLPSNPMGYTVRAGFNPDNLPPPTSTQLARLVNDSCNRRQMILFSANFPEGVNATVALDDFLNGRKQMGKALKSRSSWRSSWSLNRVWNGFTNRVRIE